MSEQINLYFHDDCLQHDPGAYHPENPGRLAVVIEALRNSAISGAINWLEAPLGLEEQVLLAHDADLVETVKATAPDSGRAALDPDTVMSSGSLNAALRAVGAVCKGVDDLLAGSGKQVFCLTRPPGHHATPQHSMGFCIFNQLAIGAMYARSNFNLARVAIIDFDVHHGNGTQDILQGQPGLLYVSSHQSPHYPGTGSTAENIPGNIFNLPLRAGTGHAEYLQRFEAEILPVVEEFSPQLLLVSAGFDAHQADPLGGLYFTEATYQWLGQQLQDLANRHSEGRLLSVLEGGYNLEVLGDSVTAYLRGIVASA